MAEKQQYLGQGGNKDRRGKLSQYTSVKKPNSGKFYSSFQPVKWESGISPRPPGRGRGASPRPSSRPSSLNILSSQPAGVQSYGIRRASPRPSSPYTLPSQSARGRGKSPRPSSSNILSSQSASVQGGSIRGAPFRSSSSKTLSSSFTGDLICLTTPGLSARQYASGKWSTPPLPSKLPLPPNHWIVQQQQLPPPPPLPPSGGSNSSSSDDLQQQQQPAGITDITKKLKAALKIDY